MTTNEAGMTTTTTSSEAGSTSAGGAAAFALQVSPPIAFHSFSGATTHGGTFEGLKNFVDYSFAIATFDAYGNVGPLSTPICGTPQPVDDFFKQYRQAGGQAGGSFCSLESGAASPVTFFVVATAAFIGIFRRRRRG